MFKKILRISLIPKIFYSKETHFGFEKVAFEDKQTMVNEVFTNVASKYDLMNDVMSLGIHRLWKDYFINKLEPIGNISCLDVASGTGDISFRIVDSYIKEKKLNYEKENTNQFSLTVCDINPSMIEVGQQRASQLGISKYINWLIGNAEQLELNDNQFDLYTIAFGIRNCTDVQKVLNEAFRVLKPYGRFMCLEFSTVNNFLLKMAYDKYSIELIPVLGQLIAGDFRSYKYLVESIRQFPNQNEFKSMIENSGFRAVTYENLMGGIVSIHSGYKI